MYFRIDTRRFTAARTKRTAIAFFHIDCWTEQRILCKEAEQRTYRTNRITISTSASLGENGDNNKTDRSNDKDR